MVRWRRAPCTCILTIALSGLDTLDLIFGVQLVYAIILQRVGGVEGINDHVLVCVLFSLPLHIA